MICSWKTIWEGGLGDLQCAESGCTAAKKPQGWSGSLENKRYTLGRPGPQGPF